MLICGVMAVTMRSIIRNAICLAVSSAALGVIMFIMGAKTAAVFEVSVCSGLITVIFISGISLSNIDKDNVRKEFADHRQMNLLPLILIVAGIIVMLLAIKIKFSIAAVPAVDYDFSEIFWNQRNADIWGQIIVMLTGGTAISVLIKEEKKRK